MTLIRPFIAMAMLGGFVGFDLAMSSWQFTAVQPMSAFPAFIFAAVSSVTPRQTTAARVFSVFVACAATVIFLALKLNATH